MNPLLEKLTGYIDAAIERGEPVFVDKPAKPWYDFSELVAAIRRCETEKQFERMEGLCDKAFEGGVITARQLAKLDSLQADCMIERGVL